MRFLKQDTPFLWDETTQLTFDALRKDLLSAPLLHPPYCSKYFILYLAASESNIGVVLVQEDDKLQEHVVYYLSRALAGPELKYSHVDKLALAAVYAVQRLRHYSHSGGRCKSFSICFVPTHNRGKIQQVDSHSPRI